MWKKLFFLMISGVNVMVWQGCEYQVFPGPVNCEDNPVHVELISVHNPNCALKDGRIEVAATGGTGTYVFSIDNAQTQSSPVFDGQAAGIYQISAIDENNCSATLEVTLRNENGLNISFAAREAGCEGSNGSLTVTAFDGAAPYEYRIDDGAFSSANTFEGLSSGEYNLAVRDESGCEVTQKIKIKSGISYSVSISGIISNNCAINSCHNGSQFPDFRVFKNIHDNAAQIKKLTAERVMPQEGTLTQAQIDMIGCWVDDGAPDN